MILKKWEVITNQIEKNFGHANKQYQELGVDPNKAIFLWMVDNS